MNRSRWLVIPMLCGLAGWACENVVQEFDFDGDGVGDEEDCDPDDPEIYPEAPDDYGDGVDQDCDDCPDGGGDGIDRDCDGYPANEGLGPDLYDCDDNDDSVHPLADDPPDGVDQDCDGYDGSPCRDEDGDGYDTCGEDGLPETGDEDCDDYDPASHPGADEVCDGRDNDCDGAPGDDELDEDQDGVMACDGDCDDEDASVHPGGGEICDGKDNDCDPVTHEELDRDGDGLSICDGDCNDDDERVSPLALEICDGQDNDCDEVVDEECITCTVTIVPGPGAIASALAISVSGDGICAEPGTYDGQVDFAGLDVNLVALGGPALTTIDAGEAGSAVTFSQGESAAALLSGFTVTGGESLYGGGLFIDGASPTIAHLVIRGNRADYYGGGVYAGGSSAALDNVTITDNEVGYSGGALHATDSTLELTHARIADNVSSLFSGGLHLSAASLEMRNAIVTGNSAYDDGGGLGADASSWVGLENTVFAGNYCGGRGGALYLLDTPGSVSNSVVWNNDAIQGGGLASEPGAITPSITDTLIWDNSGGDVWGMGDPSGFDGNLAEDPGFLEMSGIVPENWDLHLTLDSPLVDEGGDGLLDPDGGPSDIGAFGGPDAGSWDLDRDGFPAWWHPGDYDRSADPADGWDCDDEDPSLFPGSGCE